MGCFLIRYGHVRWRVLLTRVLLAAQGSVSNGKCAIWGRAQRIIVLFPILVAMVFCSCTFLRSRQRWCGLVVGGRGSWTALTYTVNTARPLGRLFANRTGFGENDQADILSIRISGRSSSAFLICKLRAQRWEVEEHLGEGATAFYSCPLGVGCTREYLGGRYLQGGTAIRWRADNATRVMEYVMCITGQTAIVG